MKTKKTYNELVGKRFDRLVALKDIGMIRRKQSSPKKTHFFLFKCDCGKQKEISISDVINGKIHSCGCLKHEQNINHKGRVEGNPKHGDCHKRIYQIYHNIKGKCYNKNNNRYANFGGRGIVMCDEWKNDYIAFREWSYKNGYDPEVNNSLCRKDLDKNFSPENCFFSTISYNRKNAMCEYTKEQMKKRAKEWRDKNQNKIHEYINRGRKTKLKKYGKLVNNNREKATWKCGWRNIGGAKIYFRSRWEANYARYLQLLKEKGIIVEWMHEPKTFLFKDGRSFLPDFEVIKFNGYIEYHEVKGWNDERSKHHFESMINEYPKECLVIIFAKDYNEIKKKYSKLIPEWEK